MASQQRPISTQTLEVGPESNERRWTSDGSVTVNVSEEQPSEKKEEEDVEASPTIPTPPVDDFPDGGLAAWSVVFGSTCAIFATFGLVNAWGVFQSYYKRILIPETDTSTIAWIGSIQYALVFFPGLIAGRLFDLGYFKRTMFISSVILAVATVLTAECQEFWQLLLCQGLLTGFCCGMIFSPIPAVASQWFKTRRALAFGVMSTGSSLGGTIIPIAASNLIELIGFKWTMRVIALIELFMLTIANLTLRRRIEARKQTGPFFAWHDFKKPAFNVFAIGGILNFLGLFTLLTFIDLSATSIGISPKFSFYLVSITNAGSGLGRVSSGLLADRFGALTVTGPLTLMCAIMTYIWPFVSTKGALIAIGIVYGFCSGAYVSLLPVPLMMMGDMHDAGRRTGSFLTCIALGAVAGPPISGAIAQATDGFKSVGYYAGSCILGAVGFMYLTKYLMTGSLRGKC
ncbi:MFS general substrate transporter [Thelephora terrestris]|uniref:MFS general substrate transporter n=1 Tax=Thelephora terrestris TaxID=56493 RepID=A0A9P6HBJ4_9AGAM|nr:MFS general substrate transporter [Thelephora terrestris]